MTAAIGRGGLGTLSLEDLTARRDAAATLALEYRHQVDRAVEELNAAHGRLLAAESAERRWSARVALARAAAAPTGDGAS